MPGESFTRPRDQFRFKFGGMKLNTPADNLPPDKFALAINIRSVDDTSIRTRPGQTLQFSTASVPITDMRTYAALLTGDAIRTLIRNAIDNIYLDNGALVGTLASAVPPAPGASMLPFRPSQSPNPYMYIANGMDYQKFSAPDASNVVTQQKVGIAEPRTEPLAALLQLTQSTINESASWTPGGTASGTSGGTRVNDTVGAVFLDPTPGTTLWSIQVGNAANYQRLMVVRVGPTQELLVQDVFPPLTTAVNIQGIYYFTGTTGRCIIVPFNLGAGHGVGTSIFSKDNLLASLRRGAIIQVGTELCLVWSVTTGPDGTVAIETSTVGTHTTADTLISVPTIQILGGAISTGQNIFAGSATYSVGTGIGTETNTLISNPFVVLGQAFQDEDFMTFGIKVDNVANLIEAKILIDISDGTFTKDFYYYSIRPSDISSAVSNTATQLATAQDVLQREAIAIEISSLPKDQQAIYASTQLDPGSNVWGQIVFPLGQMTRVGSDATKSLQNMVKIQFLWNASGTINVQTGLIEIFGGYQPDVGDVGAPYQYRVRPRSTITGVVGNPSPSTRFGVSPRRESVIVTLPSAAYDPQIDTWDIFRFGGSVTSWRYIGSQPSTNTMFIDNYDDAAALAGEALDFDNFEPWPSVDLPLNTLAQSVTGTTALVTIPDPTNVLRYLPGNLVRIGGQNVYTLRTRPTLTGTLNQYLFQFEENAGALTNTALNIYEPEIARQFLPYMWGPDDAGTVFAVGDPLRPGTLYFSKNYYPDSAPDAYNIELVQPSEPLQGGEILDGRSFVASPERWWALYPQPQDPVQRYNAVLQPIPRGLVAPFGHCNDGFSIYWWAKDGIWSSSKGSLTDADLYNIFPHEGIPGTAVTYGTPPVGRTIFPPDYTKAGGFRLAYCNYYLYATYQDASGAYNTLVYDVRRDAWSLDQHPDQVSLFYHPEQTTNELLMGDVDGDVLMETANVNDDGTPITCLVATMEFDAGDIRAPKQWGDLFLDSTPASATGLSLNPTSFSAPITAPIIVPSSGVRIRQPISLGGLVIADTFGLIILWTDDFTSQTVPTRLFVWQPSLSIQPANTIAWQTFGASFGLQGYGHIPQISVAWVSRAPITLSITSVDGQSPVDTIIPSSGGKYNKQLFRISANKGQLYNFKAVSAQPFQFFLDDFEIAIGAWSRSTPYTFEKRFGGEGVSSAPI